MLIVCFRCIMHAQWSSAISKLLPPRGSAIHLSRVNRVSRHHTISAETKSGRRRRATRCMVQLTSCHAKRDAYQSIADRERSMSISDISIEAGALPAAKVRHAAACGVWRWQWQVASGQTPVIVIAFNEHRARGMG